MRAILQVLHVLLWPFMALPIHASETLEGENCHLTSPPDGSGDDIAPGPVVARIYPRRGDIAKQYTGCQTAWSESSNSASAWQIISVTHISNGIADSFYKPVPMLDICRYANGELVNKIRNEHCPSFQSLILRSMAPGCARKILGRAGNAGCQHD